MPQGDRRLLRVSELWPQERLLCKASEEGSLLDLRSGGPADDSPLFVDEWSEARTIRAQVIYQLLTGDGPTLADSVSGVRLMGARVVGRLNLGGRRLQSAIELRRCYVQSAITISKAQAENISFRESILHGGLNARRASIQHTLNIAEVRFDRRVVLAAAHIGTLYGKGLIITAPGGEAICADRLEIDAGLFLNDSVIQGQVSLLDARVHGRLSCRNLALTTPQADGIYADRLSVQGAADFCNVKVSGTVSLAGARIAGYLDLTRAQIGCDSNTVGLEMVRLQADQNVHLQDAQVTGCSRFIGATIGGALDMSRIQLDSGGCALDLEAARIAESVHFYPRTMSGSIDLRRCKVGAWYDNKLTWSRRVELDGFEYEAIAGHETSTAERVSDWLPKDRRYQPQPYEQLAKAYRKAGDGLAARSVLIAGQKARRSSHPNPWRRWPNVVWSALLRISIGYGYAPSRIVFLLIGLAIAGSVVFALVQGDTSLLRPMAAGPRQPAFEPVRYTLDLLLPVAGFRQREHFVTDGWIAWFAFAMMFAGWLLALTLVAGLTGVFKKD